MLLQLRYLYRLFLTFLLRFKIIIIFSIIIGILAFFFISYIAKRISIEKYERIGIVGRYRNINDLPTNISSLIGNGLTKINEKGELEPDLAVSWETNDKGKNWTFKIDTTRKWHNGNGVVASDFKYDFHDAEYKVEGKDVLTFTLKDNFSPFPNTVARPVFKEQMGTGEWKIKQIKNSKGFIKNLSLQNSNAQRKLYIFYANEEDVKIGFKLGEIDKIEGLYTVSPFDSWKGTTMQKNVKYDQVVSILLNNEDELLSDKTLRQALNYAINKSNIGLTRAKSPISNISFYYNPQVKSYDYDKEKAKKVIDELDSEIKEKLIISLYTSPLLLPLADNIKRDWQEIGVNTEILSSTILPEDYDAYLTIIDLPYDPDQYSLWHSTQRQTNISHYSSPRIDKLLEQGRNELDVEERKKIYFDFQRFILEDTPALFLYHPYTYDISR